MIHTQTFEWRPKTKARPRVTKYGTYTEKATLDAEKNLANQYNGPVFDGPISVKIEFTNTQVHLTIEDCDPYENRKLNGDIDNFAKLLLDGLNTIAYIDDRQIRTLLASKL